MNTHSARLQAMWRDPPRKPKVPIRSCTCSTAAAMFARSQSAASAGSEGCALSAPERAAGLGSVPVMPFEPSADPRQPWAVLKI
jgi:hypothetical protein